MSTSPKHEPDEFGAFPHDVSSLRSRFEQLSQPDKAPPTPAASPSKPNGPRPLIKRAPPSPVNPFAAHLPSQPNQGVHNDASSEQHQGATLGAGLVPPRLPSSQHASSSRSVSPLPGTGSTGSSSAGGAANNHQQRPVHSKKNSEAKLMYLPSAFGAPAPSLLIQKPDKAHVYAHTNGSHPSAKAPPPRPPKPADKFKILDDADLEHLRSQARVSSLTHKFTQGAQESAERLSEAVAHAFSPQHSRQRSHPAEDLHANPPHTPREAVPPPAIPPKPLKSVPSSDSLLAVTGTAAALSIETEANAPEMSPPFSEPASMPASAPPPLPSRTAELKSPVKSVRSQRYSLSASKSTGSLPGLGRPPNGEDMSSPLPPLPARRVPSAVPESSAAANTPILPPPQRINHANLVPSSVPASRSVSSAYHAPTTTPELHVRKLQRAPSLSSNNAAYTIQPPPPPPPPLASRSFGSSLSHARFLSSHATPPPPSPAREPSSDSSDEEEYGEMAAHLLSPSSLVGPPSTSRPSGAFGGPSAAELPDSSRANRRAPKFLPDCSTAAKAGFQCFAACGHTVVTGSGDKVKVYRVGELATGLGEKLCTVGEHGNSKELKLTALEFRPPNHDVPPVPAFGVRSHGETADEGRYLWCGTKDGHLWELDVAEAQTVYSRTTVHTAPIQLLRRIGNKMISMDESGKISTWLPSSDPDPAVRGLRLSNQPITQRIALEKGSCAMMLGQQLWVASGPAGQRSSKDAAASSKGPRIRIYNPFADDKPFNATSKTVTMSPDMAVGVGAVTGGTIIPSKPDRAYLAHDSGHISIWSRQTFECLGVQKLGPNGVTAVAGVVKYLWAANRTGNIAVYDVDAVPWRAIKIWPAHKEPVTSLRVDEHGVAKVKRLQVASAGLDASVHLWDGTLSFDWLQLEQSKRETEFCTYRNLKILQVTFNVDAASPLDLETTVENMDLFPNLLRNACNVGGDVKAGGVAPERPPDIIVFGFQELIDLESKKLTAKSLLLGSGKRKANDFGDRVSRQYRAWHDKLTSLVRLAMPPTCGYLLVQSESLVGLFTCVFIKQSEFKHVKETAISTVKTGMGGRYGNKGSVIARMVIDHTSLCFANCHLAAGQKHVKQRNADVADILESPTVFEDHHADPAAYVGGGDGSMILDHELCFWGGDLNYRIDLKRETVISAILTNRMAPLIEADQLRRELKTNPTFRLKPFSEAPLNL
ncbi:hypothetical protein ACQY0O_006238 [Thecaphora frezii]